jgi:hypothetical protein
MFLAIAWASTVMLGSLFPGTDESPASWWRPVTQQKMKLYAE